MLIEWQADPDQKGIFIIFVNGEEWRKIHSSIFETKFCIPLEHQVLSDLEDWFQQAELRGAKKIILAKLAFKNYSSTELRTVLTRLIVSESSINIVLKECETLGYLDDQDWIDRFIKRHCERKVGPRLIAAKLRAKGIKEEEITQAFQNNQLLSKEASQIAGLIERRYSKEDLTNFHTRRKAFAALMRKGFHPHEILEALDKYN
jgi:SOS response regulatory protein OraA/RecX